jgi:hypothetical protein
VLKTWSPAGCATLEVVDDRKWGLAGGSRSLEVCPGKVHLVPGPSLSFCFHAVMRTLSSTMPCHHDALPHHVRPIAMGSANHALKSLELSAKIIIFFHKLFFPGICHRTKN